MHCGNQNKIDTTKTHTVTIWFYIFTNTSLKCWNDQKFPPLIKAHASSMNCTMGNLTCSHHATYLHTIYVKSRQIYILSTIQILDVTMTKCKLFQNILINYIYIIENERGNCKQNIGVHFTFFNFDNTELVSNCLVKSSSSSSSSSI